MEEKKELMTWEDRAARFLRRMDLSYESLLNNIEKGPVTLRNVVHGGLFLKSIVLMEKSDYLGYLLMPISYIYPKDGSVPKLPSGCSKDASILKIWFTDIIDFQKKIYLSIWNILSRKKNTIKKDITNVFTFSDMVVDLLESFDVDVEKISILNIEDIFWNSFSSAYEKAEESNKYVILLDSNYEIEILQSRSIIVSGLK